MLVLVMTDLPKRAVVAALVVAQKAVLRAVLTLSAGSPPRVSSL